MAKTKVIAFDIYGTLLCEDDPDNEMPPRLGFAKFILQAKSLAIKLASTSDENNATLLIDLRETFADRVPFGPEVFDKYYRLAMVPKDYSRVLIDFSINPEELLIIGNDEYKDLSRAPASSSKILVPTYHGLDNSFDLSGLAIP